MNAAFADELIKLGALGTLLRLAAKPVKFVAKRPLQTLGAGLVVGPPLLAMHQARKGALAGGEKPRYLAAGRDETGRIRASDSAYVNWHGLFPHDPSPKQVRALSKYHKKMFG